jgi:hypothetical protein
LSWYGFYNVVIEEEPPGEHFAEFQIGFEGIPNDFVIDKIVDVSQSSAPLRSRLARMYNDEYDIRRFILDESDWGDILSDNSGTRLTPDSPVVSFGRSNSFAVATSSTELAYYAVRDHFNFAINNDTYKLDWTILDESPWHTPNYNVWKMPERYVFNTDFIGDKIPNIFKPQRMAKALIVLSEGSKLDDINSCFSCGYETYEEDEPFILSFSRLSEHPKRKKAVPIGERKFRESSFHAQNEFEFFAHFLGRERDIFCTLVVDDMTAEVICERERYVSAQYYGNNTWHDHRHFDVPWKDQNWHTKIT